MPKPNDDVQELKRRVALLGRLHSQPLVLAEGGYLIESARVRDPCALVAARRPGLVPIRVAKQQSVGRAPRLLTRRIRIEPAVPPDGSVILRAPRQALSSSTSVGAEPSVGKPHARLRESEVG